MKIVIDLQGAQSYSRHRGIGRYSLSIAQAIAKNRNDHEVVIVLNGILGETLENIMSLFAKLLPKSSIRVWEGYYPASSNHKANEFRKGANALLREAFIDSLEPDMILITSIVEGYTDDIAVSVNTLMNRPTAAIFYDAIPLINPEKYILPEGKNFEKYYHERIQNYAKTELLFGISDSSCKEAVKYLNIAEDKLINIGAAADAMFKPIDLSENTVQELKRKFKITNKFLLYSGASDERKNHKGLIRAYAKLPGKIKKSYQLVIAGGMPTKRYIDFQKSVSSCGLSKKDVLFTQLISDEELVALYNLCDLYVFPSWHEGFGLPALEAMACGAPVIGSNNTSIPEVIGRDDALFDPLNEDDIAKKITEVLDNEPFRQELKQHSLLQSGNFSWDKSALKIIRAFENRHTASRNANERVLEHNRTDYQKLLIDKISKLPGKYSEKDLLNISRCVASNHRSSSNKQLFVDISELVKEDAKSGIQRVVKSVLNELMSNPPAGYLVEPVYATRETPGYCYAKHLLSKHNNSEKNNLLDEARIDVSAGDIFLGLDLSPTIQTEQKLYYQILKEHGVDLYFIIYDILLLQNPQWWPVEASIAFEKLLTSITEIATGLICISESVANEVRKWINQNPLKHQSLPKVMSFHLGADIENSAPSKGLPENSRQILHHLRSRHSFLMVGTIEPRKGHSQTLEAFEKLWIKGQDINLVIVGKEGWMVEELINKLRTHPEKDQHLFWLEGISDEYLEKVYAASSCLIASSQGEGFGLPLIEAAQHQLPIIARDLPVFHEVAGEYAYYFENNNDPEVLADAVTKWLDLYEKNLYPKSDSMSWLTWKESTTELLKQVNIGISDKNTF